MTGRPLRRLSAQHPAVVALTVAAVRASSATRPMAIRCRHGHLLAYVGDTGSGILFTSSWEDDEDARLPGGGSLHSADGTAATARQVRRYVDTMMIREGPAPSRQRHGVVALLNVPPEHPQDYPALVVRCRCGDAELDRIQVVGWLRTAKAPPKVQVGKRLAYVTPDASDPVNVALMGARSAKPRTSRTTYRQRLRGWGEEGDTPGRCAGVGE